MDKFIAIAASATPAEVAADLQHLIDTPPADACPTAMRHLRRELGSLGTAAGHRADVGMRLQQVWVGEQALMLSGFVFDHPDGAFEIDHLIVNKLGAITLFLSAHFYQGDEISVTKEGVWEIRRDAAIQSIESPIERAEVLRQRLTWVLQNRLVGQLPFEIDRNSVTFVVVVPDCANFTTPLRRLPVLRVGALGVERRLREIRSSQFHFASGGYNPESGKEVIALQRHLQIFARLALGDSGEFASNLLQAKAALEAVAGSPTPDYYLRKTGVVSGHVERMSGHDVALLPSRAASAVAQGVQQERLAAA